jgi:hypothetical protein
MTNVSLPITHYPLPITHYPLPITHYPLPMTMRNWLNTIIRSSQQNPARFVECLMLLLATSLVILWMMPLKLHASWAYLVLSSSYTIGAAASIWVRESIEPSHQQRLMQTMAILALFLIASITLLVLFGVYINGNGNLKLTMANSGLTQPLRNFEVSGVVDPPKPPFTRGALRKS